MFTKCTFLLDAPTYMIASSLHIPRQSLTSVTVDDMTRRLDDLEASLTASVDATAKGATGSATGTSAGTGPGTPATPAK